jgi:uncharacterized protein YggE
MANVTVRGSATASVRPDRVVVQLGITHIAADAGTALDEVAERSRKLEHLLRDLGFAPQDWVTEGVQVAEEWQWRNDSNVLVGYRATSGVATTVRAFDIVGTLIRDAVRDCGANVRDLSWRVDPDNPTRSELLDLAARDARRRAEAYTTALGLRLGEVELIDEMPINAGGTPRLEAHGAPMVAMAYAKSADAGAPVSVSGGLIDLVAEVYVRFAILPGG